MKIVIAGAGRIGSSVATELAREKHDVTVIDSNPEIISQLAGNIDAICIEGRATDVELLREAGTQDADLFIAVTENDEVNMVSSQLARQLGAGALVARIRGVVYAGQETILKEAFGLTVIVNPELECAREISRILRFPGASRVLKFSRGGAEIAEYVISRDSPLNGARVSDVWDISKARVLVAIVRRGDEVLIPDGSFVLQEKDRIVIIGTMKETRTFFISIGAFKKPVRSVMILGGNAMAVHLSHLLQESGIAVTIVEKDPDECQRLCDASPAAKVICGDGMSSSVLLEEGIEYEDAFVSLTRDDGENIVTSLYAEEKKVPTVITKVDHEHFLEVVASTGLDTIIVPKQVVTNQIVRCVKAIINSYDSSMETLYRLADDRAEALEFCVGKEFPSRGVPLREMKLHPNVLVAAVTRGSRTIIPDGNCTIETGDNVVVVAPAGAVSNLSDILEKGSKNQL